MEWLILMGIMVYLCGGGFLAAIFFPVFCIVAGAGAYLFVAWLIGYFSGTDVSLFYRKQYLKEIDEIKKEYAKLEKEFEEKKKREKELMHYDENKYPDYKEYCNIRNIASEEYLEVFNRYHSYDYNEKIRTAFNKYSINRYKS